MITTRVTHDHENAGWTVDLGPVQFGPEASRVPLALRVDSRSGRITLDLAPPGSTAYVRAIIRPNGYLSLERHNHGAPGRREFLVRDAQGVHRYSLVRPVGRGSTLLEALPTGVTSLITQEVLNLGPGES